MQITRKTTRPRGFAPWNPRPATLALLGDVRGVLAAYRDHLPLTIRQIFYRLVATRDFPKDERDYARLCETLNRARRAGLIAFDAIRDDGATRLEPTSWESPADFRAVYQKAAERFRLDRQTGQPVRLWLLCEAGGMGPMLGDAVADFGVPVLPSGGFDSLTVKRDLAAEIAEHLPAGQRCEILHVGDHDPSGVHLFSSLAEDVRAMCFAISSGWEPTFTRLAVTPAQIIELGLPSAPPKKTDRRAFTGETVQAEAIAPDVLSRIVRDAIEQRQDASIRADLLAREAVERGALLRGLGV